MIKSLLKNSTTNMMVPILKLCITFVMAPIIIKALGNYDYGIWEIVFSVVGYMGVLDLGLQPAIVRYVARYNAMGQGEHLRKIYSSSLVFMGLMGGAILLFFAAWAAFAPGLLAEKAADSSTYKVFLLIIGAQVFFTFTGSVFECFHEGFQRYNLRNIVTIIYMIAGNVALFYLLQRGYGLLTLALVNMIGFSTKYILYGVLLAFPRFGRFRFNGNDLSWASLKELFVFGTQSLIQAVAGRLSMATDSIVIGAFLGPVMVTFFVIPSNLINHIRTLCWAMTRAFMPLFSDLDARGERESSARILMVGSRYVLGLIIPVLGAVCLLGPPFIARWIGAEYAEKGRWVLYIFAAAYLVQWMNPFSNRLLTGIGKQGILAKVGVVSAVFNIVLSVILVQFLGKEGVALGTLIPYLVFEPVILYFTCKHIDRTMRQYLREVLLPLAIPNAAFLSALWFMTSAVDMKSYSGILSAAMVSGSIYAVLFYALSIGKEEQRFILGKIKARLA
ncbi:MAG: oligosaccharide flippase family protein [Deltaproteobacteria bacterium]|nr:oligosaccharide flippase family protein [Deltaproteobacteria bacterium]